MDNAPIVFPFALNVLLFLVLGGTIVVWSLLIERLSRGVRILPVEPRRQVPWRGIDLVVIFLFVIVCGSLFGWLGSELLDIKNFDIAPLKNSKDIEQTHLIVRLLNGANGLTIFGCVVAAVFVAPITEEILFRLFLQGWLERVDRWCRSRIGMRGIWFRWGTVPVILSSFLFAAIHFRGKPQEMSPDTLLYLLVISSVVKVFVTLFAIGWVRWVRGATAADLGWQPEKLLPDIGLGLAAFTAVVVPVYACQVGVTYLLPEKIAPDPIPLFFFALVLGTLYLRTHRIVPAIAAHMGLNAFSLLMLWASLGGGQ